MRWFRPAFAIAMDRASKPAGYDTIASLEQLGERDERIVISGIDDDLVRQDEQL